MFLPVPKVGVCFPTCAGRAAPPSRDELGAEPAADGFKIVIDAPRWRIGASESHTAAPTRTAAKR